MKCAVHVKSRNRSLLSVFAIPVKRRRDRSLCLDEMAGGDSENPSVADFAIARMHREAQWLYVRTKFRTPRGVTCFQTVLFNWPCRNEELNSEEHTVLRNSH